MSELQLGRFSSDIIRSTKTVDMKAHKPTHASAFLVWYSKPTSDVRNVVELGSGTGIVAFSLAKLYNLNVTGIELQGDLYRLSLEGITLNDLEGKVAFVNADVQKVRELFSPESFDMTVCNLPFHIGKESQNEIRRISRNANTSVINAFVDAASYLLRNKGTFVFVTAPKILVPIMSKLSKENLVVQRMCFFHGTPLKSARFVAIRGKKNGGQDVVVDPPQWGEITW
ncbi:MAG TPA: methyltransferase [Fervidobacterium sp.]|nr:methyltransferase [Fervidobacterium sp.]HOM73892.1 methyltransferase [Fervidobacterium sp.]HOQ39169.1 methyltransferase [Fervidobacterium sp.]HPP17623.1 methyltransferase [Fervidobacterium sp.]HPT53937.1 methyltransferase [Fervidobacterium sp.]